MTRRIFRRMELVEQGGELSHEVSPCVQAKRVHALNARETNSLHDLNNLRMLEIYSSLSSSCKRKPSFRIQDQVFAGSFQSFLTKAFRRCHLIRSFASNPFAFKEYNPRFPRRSLLVISRKRSQRIENSSFFSMKELTN